MESADTSPTVASVDSDFAIFGAVHLDVTDLDRALGFWRDLIGLQALATRDEMTVLGCRGVRLVVLHPGASGSAAAQLLRALSPASTPTLEDFARIQARAESVGYPQHPTDHLTHWANYLTMPMAMGWKWFEPRNGLGRWWTVRWGSGSSIPTAIRTAAANRSTSAGYAPTCRRQSGTGDAGRRGDGVIRICGWRT
ncbi:MAG: hypothetical protein R2848_00850 [Thermomicrobiales bacterium]